MSPFPNSLTKETIILVHFSFFGTIDKHYGSVCFVMLFVYVIISDGYTSSIFNSLGMMCFNRVHITLTVFSPLIPTVTHTHGFPQGGLCTVNNYYMILKGLTLSVCGPRKASVGISLAQISGEIMSTCHHWLHVT